MGTAMSESAICPPMATQHSPRSLPVFADFTPEVFGSDFAGVSNVTPQFMKKFNETTTNNPAVRYFSWAGHLTSRKARYAPVLALIKGFHPESDGVVGVESAIWGTHLGTVLDLSQ
ncbi:hypothetical protein FA13DRAFT_1741814 [Coprinellus micaceus]|uniref:Uncharacterized protein n=1 Tax=Coprinellus micaceus TaxID=71717 RepID=A0A4Y7SIB1_COPMI|nr:hypothetical protein FA13DRAFT_1741814 [Coprinellus micaceus]